MAWHRWVLNLSPIPLSTSCSFLPCLFPGNQPTTKAPYLFPAWNLTISSQLPFEPFGRGRDWAETAYSYPRWSSGVAMSPQSWSLKTTAPANTFLSSVWLRHTWWRLKLTVMEKAGGGTAASWTGNLSPSRTCRPHTARWGKAISQCSSGTKDENLTLPGNFSNAKL